MSLTVACLFVEGEYPYTPEYVYNLKAMCERWIDRPFEFVCLTDRPGLLPGIETIPISKFPDCFAYWTKLEVFNPSRNWEGRVLYLDLDTVPVAPLDAIIDHPAPFVITADSDRANGTDKYGRKIIRRFNSSVVAWDNSDGFNCANDLFHKWTPAAAKRLSGDQDWVADQMPGAVSLPRSWFPRLSEVPQGPPFSPDVKVVLTKHPKQHVAVERYPWLEPLWRLA